jgi:hypothetical protein
VGEFPVRNHAIYNASLEHHLTDYPKVTEGSPSLIMLRVVERTNIPLFAEITERCPNTERRSTVLLNNVSDLTGVKVLGGFGLAGVHVGTSGKDSSSIPPWVHHIVFS